MKDKLAIYAVSNPSATQGEAAEHFGVSKQRISQAAKKMGIKFRQAPRGPKREGVKPQNVDRLPRGAERHTYKNRGSIFRGREYSASSNKTMRGCASEMLVIADLLDLGCNVWMQASKDAPCDLIVKVEDDLLRFEVKTVQVNSHGIPIMPPTKPEKFDVLACVCRGGEIFYFPPVTEW